MIDVRFIKRKIKSIIISLSFNYLKRGYSVGSFIYFGRNVNIAKGFACGDCVYIGQYSYIGPNVKIGNFSLISDNVNIIGHDHVFNIAGVPTILSGVPEDKLITTIGDDVWIGHAATIMRGVKLGDGCIIAANSVVTKNVPAFEIWAGVPARKINVRFTSSDQEKHIDFLNKYRAGFIKLRHDRRIT